MDTISQREFRNENAMVMRRVEAGESFIVTRHGKPVADVIPHQPQGTRTPRFVPANLLVEALSDLPPWNAQSFDADNLDLDDQLDDQDRDPWS